MLDLGKDKNNDVPFLKYFTITSLLLLLIFLLLVFLNYFSSYSQFQRLVENNYNYTNLDEFCNFYIKKEDTSIKQKLSLSIYRELYTDYRKGNIIIKFDKDLMSCTAYNKRTDEVEYSLFVPSYDVKQDIEQKVFNDNIKRKFINDL